MNGIDLFSGMGGFSLGFIKAGFKILYAIDNWKFVKKSYTDNIDSEFILADIRELNPYDFLGDKIDFIIGSPPCKELSIANFRSLKDKGMELVKVFLKWIEVIKPKYWIMENVSQIIPLLKRGTFNITIPIIAEYDLVNYAIPQFRVRAFSGAFKRLKPTHSKLGGIDLFGNKIHKWNIVRKALRDMPPQEYSDKLNKRLIPRDSEVKDSFYTKHGEQILDEPCRTITTKDDFKLIRRNQNINLSLESEEERKVNLRRFTPRELMRIQTFPDSYKISGSLTNQYKMIGNSVPPYFSYQLALEINGVNNNKFNLMEFIQEE